ncbi:sodium-dependent glucose transporter 1-like [Uloborus diversus]|uniref:sodium-dependent glucose transporter 1-like n=1 Tax=Uloborus diversus TaxID=327109 RepID=UPI0024097DD3|nr:sodium-dependent glucose transporter 1-like [Uloborus diversus]
MIKVSDRCLLYYRTAILYISFLSLGLCTAIPGPTLLDLQTIVKTSTKYVTYIYLGRSSGYLIGSLIGGIILDCMKKREALLVLFNLIISISVLLIPFSRDVVTLVAVMAVSGSVMGALDTGANVWCLNLWSGDNSPYFQALHFLFGIGAFLAPLVAEPFLDKNNETLEILNTSYAANIITLLFLSLFCFANDNECAKEKRNVQYSNPHFCITVLIISLTFLLLGVYAGIEIGFGQMIATYAVKSDLHLSKSDASYLTSLYWASFTVFRGVGILLAAKFSSLSLILFDFCLMLISGIVLLIFGNSSVAMLWFGTGLLGCALSSFYPSAVYWTEKYVNVSNKVASSFVVAASFGEMIVPFAISQFLDDRPEFFSYILLSSILVCGILILFLWITTSKVGVKAVIDENIETEDAESRL